MKATIAKISILMVVSLCSTANALELDTVLVGNPGNAGNEEGTLSGTKLHGAVAYEYRIGRTEVTNQQYVEFLNAVAASDPYELYNPQMGSDSRGGIVRSGSPGSFTYTVKPNAVGQGPNSSDYTYLNKPVVYVSFYDSLRFVNWLENGQGSGGTEDGAYTLLGGTPIPSNGAEIIRNRNAKWILPSEDEWYKAAFHKNDGATGNYWKYPTATDALPDNNIPSLDSGNSANYVDFDFEIDPFLTDEDYTTGNPDYPMTDAGAYLLSGSSYGTFDQAGNVFEWNESMTDLFPDSMPRGLLGGAWQSLPEDFDSLGLSYGSRHLEGSILGFRIAKVPEPNSILLSGMILIGILSLKRCLAENANLATR